ncbi:MAG: TolC family protein [Elusimicrobia bacterium]|nr:TolC family protein [Elusimicrobiota bacterium]
MKKVCSMLIITAFVSQGALWAEPASQSVAGQKELSLERAITLLVENNPAIREAEQSAEAAVARKRQKAGDLFPQIDLAASYTKLSPDPSVDFPGLGLIQFFPEQNYDAHIVARQTLFDFGKKWDTYKATKYSSEAAKNAARAVKSNLKLQTVYTFYSILLLQKSIEVQNQELKSLNEYLEITQKKLASGTATGFDVLTIQVKLEEAKNKKIDLENNCAKQLITMRRLICLPDSDSEAVTGDLQVQSEPIDTASFLALAAQERPELKAARATTVSAKMLLGSSRSERYPSINLFYEYGYKNGYLPDLAAIVQDTVAGARFDMPLFGGFTTYNKIKEAQAQHASLQAREKDMEGLVIAEVKQAASDVETNAKKIDAAVLHVKLAQEAVSQAKVRFENGVITNLDMLNADNALAEAKLLQLQANFNYIVSRETLKKAAGIEPGTKN